MNNLIEDNKNSILNVEDQEDDTDYSYNSFFITKNGVTELKEGFVIEPDYSFNGKIIGFSICLDKNKF